MTINGSLSRHYTTNSSLKMKHEIRASISLLIIYYQLICLSALPWRIWSECGAAGCVICAIEDAAGAARRQVLVIAASAASRDVSHTSSLGHREPDT